MIPVYEKLLETDLKILVGAVLPSGVFLLRLLLPGADAGVWLPWG